jgi:hypothetical protein
MSNPKCPYCGNRSELVTGAVIYPHRPDLHGKFFYQCAPCDAYVGCHPTGNGKSPLGRLADKELRKAKSDAHAAFDPLWRNGAMSRHQAYRYLAQEIGVPQDKAHIGMFDIAQCKRVVQIALKEQQP